MDVGDKVRHASADMGLGEIISRASGAHHVFWTAHHFSQWYSKFEIVVTWRRTEVTP